MTIRWSIVTPRRTGDVAELYVEARVHGLEVSHYPNVACKTFDASPKSESALGVFRDIGGLIFYKDERRWEVRARNDANAVELATLIECGLYVVAKYGRTPGHWTRTKSFRHIVSHRTGKRIAWTDVCYRLSAEDLLNAGAEAASVEELITRVLEESQS